jgi:CTP synthase (UTP-ammonia lyase)
VSPQGVLDAIRHARERDIPYIGTCAGFQYGLIEFTRNVLGIPDADTAENAPEGKNIVITPIECPVPSRSGPAMNGSSVVHPVPGTMLHRLCGSGALREEYFCNFATNADYVPRWEAAGLKIAARGDGGEVRAFELPTRRFFVASLFQPQLSSSFDRPHPIIAGFLRACAAASERK